MEIVKKYGQIIVILFLLLCTGLTWNSRENQRKDYETLKNSVKIQQSLDETKSQLDAMLKRQKELYPVLQKTWDDLKVAEATLEKRKKEISITERKKIQDEVDQMDCDDLSDNFSELGYANEPTGCIR